MATQTNIPNGLTSQNIKTQVTVAAGQTQEIRIDIPQDITAYVEQYGYDWFASTTYRLAVSDIALPERTDQEGSISQPRIFGNPLPVKPSLPIRFLITNNDSSDHDYQFMVILLTDRIINYTSSGGAIITQTSSTSGGGANTNVAIYDSTFTSAAPVTSTFGIGVDPKPPATVLNGKASLTGTAAAIGAGALKRGVLIQNPPSNTVNALVGNSTTQTYVLEPGTAIFIDCDNLNDVYAKQETSALTVNYIGS